MRVDLRSKSFRALAGWGLAASLGLTACIGDPPQGRSAQVAAGVPQLGEEAMINYGCGTCHVIPGVAQANGLVGPPLTNFGKRSYIAGALPNDQANLTKWLADPQDVEPGTAMPDLNVTQEDATNMSAYLLGLE